MLFSGYFGQGRRGGIYRRIMATGKIRTGDFAGGVTEEYGQSYLNFSLRLTSAVEPPLGHSNLAGTAKRRLCSRKINLVHFSSHSKSRLDHLLYRVL